MGLFDKLRGKKADEPANHSSEPAPPSPPATNAVPPRRERSKPTAHGSSSAPPAADQVSTTHGPPIGVPVIDPTQENAAVLMAIHAIVSGDTPAARANLYQALLQSTLYLVTLNHEGEGSGPLELKGGEQLQLATIRSPDGKTYLPAFTDVPRLQVSLPPKGRYVPLPARAVCGMLLQGDAEGIVINPGQPPSGLVTKAEAQILSQGAIPTVDAGGQLTGEAQQQIQIKIQKPTAPPDESFVNAIQDAAKSIADIEEVHLFSAGIENQPIKLVIGMLMRDGLEPQEMQPAFEAVGKAAHDARGNTEEFDMMPLSRDVIDAITPQVNGLIYKREV